MPQEQYSKSSPFNYRYRRDLPRDANRMPWQWYVAGSMRSIIISLTWLTWLTCTVRVYMLLRAIEGHLRIGAIIS